MVADGKEEVMGVDGKWVDQLEPGMRVAEAARRVLLARLEVVRVFLPLAVHDAERDPEFVHRLRVATRRSGAALRLFARWLPDKPLRRVKRRLRALRQAAGAARDWDVFVADLLQRRAQMGDKEQPGADFLLGYATGQRDAAQRHLNEAGAAYGPYLKDLIDDTIAAVREPSDGPRTLRALGQNLLLELLQELDWAAARPLEDYEQLHQVRILGKKLRYAMEVFADCFAPSFREVIYPQVEEMQEILGHANDSHVASQRLAALKERLKQKWPDDWKRLTPALNALLRFHRRRLPRERERFLHWWQRWQASEGVALRGLLRAETEAAPANHADNGHQDEPANGTGFSAAGAERVGNVGGG
jgi:CHAD domain-containing protein